MKYLTQIQFVLAVLLLSSFTTATLVAQDTKTEPETAKTKVKKDDDKKTDAKGADKTEGDSEKDKAEGEKEKSVELKLGDGILTMQVPESWKKKKPRNNIVESEYEVTAVEGDEINGRLTMMASGGGIEANIARWKSQFKSKDGEGNSKVEKKEIDGMEVHVVDLKGNFMDAPRGPFGPKVERENYRMLGAIVKTEKADYFLKLYGPEKTIDANAKRFAAVVESLKTKKE